MLNRSRITGLGLVALALPLAAAEWKAAESPLTTPWSSQVTPDKALPEYPRPRMVRREWTNLNGLWDFAIRPKDEKAPEKFEGSILVPFAVESALSGVKRPLTPDQKLWYRRTVRTPRLSGRHLLLHFGAVDWRAEVFVNGKAVGSHEGGFDPFSFDITEALKPGATQEITVAVWDPTDTGLNPRGKQVLNPNGIWYTAVSGMWQTVWLEPVRADYIKEISFVPDVDGRKLRIKVSSQGGGDFTATARLSGRTVGKVTGKAGTDSEIPLSALELWSPEKPTLYDLDVELKSGDSVKSYFGMRKIQVRKDTAGFNRLFLNNAPVFQIGPLDQGWWPDGLYTAPTDEALKSDIVTLKKLGFNMMRKHVKVEPARFYYWCDKLGMMVWQDMPSAMITGAKQGIRRNEPNDAVFTAQETAAWRREWQAIMSSLGNVPSIVAWVPINEGWGQHATNEILKWTKDLDPSRLVDGPSGWEDRGYGDMKDMHVYPGPGMFPVLDDRASVLGEFGGLGIPLNDHLWWNKRNWGYRTFDDPVKIQAAYEDLIDKLRPLVKQGLAAAIYTQTTDVEGEINGLITYDRKVIKYNAAKLTEIHRRLIDSVR